MYVSCPFFFLISNYMDSIFYEMDVYNKDSSTFYAACQQALNYYKNNETAFTRFFHQINFTKHTTCIFLFAVVSAEGPSLAKCSKFEGILLLKTKLNVFDSRILDH